MKLTDEDLFKPLSAKVGRKDYANGGSEIRGNYGRSGDTAKLRAVLARRNKEQPRPKKGTVQ